MFVPELLRRTGFPVDAVMTQGHPLRSVRGLSRVWMAEESQWGAAVEERLLTREYACFLNVDEPGLRALYSRSWHSGAAGFLPLHPDSEGAATVGSKKRFHEWCLRRGLPVPETHLCGSLQEARNLRKRLSGQWLLKGDMGSGGQSVTRDAFKNGFSPQQEAGHWLVQREETGGVGSGIFLADRGRVLGWIGIRKMVCLDRGMGPTVLGCGDVGPDVGELCRSVASASGISGLTGFDFVRNSAGELLLIDSHLGRMSPMNHFDRLYRMDFAAVIRDWLEGRASEPVDPGPGPGFIKFPEMLQLAMQGDLGGLVKKAGFPWKMPLYPPGDPAIGIRCGCGVLISQARVNAGALQRRLFQRKRIPARQ